MTLQVPAATSTNANAVPVATDATIDHPLIETTSTLAANSGNDAPASTSSDAPASTFTGAPASISASASGESTQVDSTHTNAVSSSISSSDMDIDLTDSDAGSTNGHSVNSPAITANSVFVSTGSSRTLNPAVASSLAGLHESASLLKNEMFALLAEIVIQRDAPNSVIEPICYRSKYG